MREKPLRELGLTVTLLVIVGIVTVLIITTFRGALPAKQITVKTSVLTGTARTPTSVVSPLPYPGPLDYRTPTEAARQTAAGPIDTQLAIIVATKMAITPSPTVPETPFPTGTVENDVYIRSSGKKLGLTTQNAWSGFLDGNRVDLYAGALLDDPSQGAIYLFVTIPNSGFMGLILTPTKHGGVRVVSEQNNRLTMISTDGTTYFFDIPARRFVNSLTEVVPSATPPATRTPLPPIPTPVTQQHQQRLD
jgi:hypothetical protein